MLVIQRLEESGGDLPPSTPFLACLLVFLDFPVKSLSNSNLRKMMVGFWWCATWISRYFLSLALVITQYLIGSNVICHLSAKVQIYYERMYVLPHLCTACFIIGSIANGANPNEIVIAHLHLELLMKQPMIGLCPKYFWNNSLADKK